jgi:hypothetical protein
LVGVLSAAAVNSDVSSDAEQIKSALKYLTSTRAAGPRVGWGYHPDTEPITEVSSWATLAYLLSLESEMSDEIWSQGEIPNVIAEIEENLCRPLRTGSTDQEDGFQSEKVPTRLIR